MDGAGGSVLEKDWRSYCATAFTSSFEDGVAKPSTVNLLEAEALAVVVVEGDGSEIISPRGDVLITLGSNMKD